MERDKIFKVLEREYMANFDNMRNREQPHKYTLKVSRTTHGKPQISATSAVSIYNGLLAKILPYAKERRMSKTAFANYILHLGLKAFEEQENGNR